jgi:hypothetical protein
MNSQLLGRVVATEKKPNTAHEFHFWTSIDSPIGIGTIVRVDAEVAVRRRRIQLYRPAVPDPRCVGP